MSTLYSQGDSQQFDSTIRKGITLVDFNAEWCVPCREQRVIVDKLSDFFSGKGDHDGA